jgi:hypothetical protein
MKILVQTYKHKDGLGFFYIVQTIGTFILASAIFGITWGIRVSDVLDTRHDITLRDQTVSDRVLADAILIMATSHHTIIKVGTRIISIPSSDIARIESKK